MCCSLENSLFRAKQWEKSKSKSSNRMRNHTKSTHHSWWCVKTRNSRKRRNNGNNGGLATLFPLHFSSLLVHLLIYSLLSPSKFLHLKWVWIMPRLKTTCRNRWNCVVWEHDLIAVVYSDSSKSSKAGLKNGIWTEQRHPKHIPHPPPRPKKVQLNGLQPRGCLINVINSRAGWQIITFLNPK